MEESEVHYMAKQDNSDTIMMVEKALTVLELLRTSRDRIGVNEIAKACDYTPSTTFRILKTLEKTGWAFQLSDNRYIAGSKLSFATEKNNLFLALKDTAIFTMEKYTERYGQAMNLLVRDCCHCYVLQQSKTNRLLDYVSPISSELPLYATAGGKVLLSDLPLNLVINIIESIDLRQLTPNTITDPMLILNELRMVGDRKYAFDFKESSEYGCCVSVPVTDNEGTIIAALSFSGFMGIGDRKELEIYIDPLREASAEISERLYNTWRKS